MGRAKVRMEPITNEKARRLTLKSRKKGLKKKLQELSTLCDVKVGMIMYEPQKDGMPPAEPEIWPNDPNEIRELYNIYKAQSNDDRQKRTADLSSYFKDRNDKLEATLMKQRKKNSEAKYPTWDPRYDDLSEAQLRELARLLETKTEAAKSRLELLKESRKVEPSIPVVGAANFYSTEFFQSLLRDNNSELGDQLQLILPQPDRPGLVISEQKNNDYETRGLELAPPLKANYTEPIMATLMNSQINYDELLDGMDHGISSDIMCMPPLNNELPAMYYDTLPTPLNIMMPNHHHHHDHDGGGTELDFMCYNPTANAMQQLLPQYAHQFPTYSGDFRSPQMQEQALPTDETYGTGHFHN